MVYPWSDFYKIKRGGGGHRSVPSRQISPLSLLKCGLTAPEIAKIGNFGYKFAQNGYTPLSDFTKFGLRERVPVSHPRAKFHHCEFKNMGLQPPKSLKLVFLVYICPKGYTPYAIFLYKIWLVGGSLRSASSYQISPFWLTKCGPTAAKLAKNCNFWYKFSPVENVWGPQKKLSIGVQLQTFLHAMTP